jgi:hypothetical protein
MRYGLNAAIVAGISCVAPGEPALNEGIHFSDYLLGSREIAPPAGLYLEDDIYFHDGKTDGGVKLHASGLRVAGLTARNAISAPTTSPERLTRNFLNGLSPWRCRPEVTLS